jgi:hypothetical protein
VLEVPHLGVDTARFRVHVILLCTVVGAGVIFQLALLAVWGKAEVLFGVAAVAAQRGVELQGRAALLLLVALAAQVLTLAQVVLERNRVVVVVQELQAEQEPLVKLS